MKKIKKALAVILAAAMACSMSMAAFADPDPVTPAAAAAKKDAEITITGLETGDTVKLYQILEWKGEEGAYAGWSLKDPFTGIVDAQVPALQDEKTAIQTIVGDPAGNPKVDMKLSAEIAGKLSKLPELATTGGVDATMDGKTAKYTIADDTQLGLYMAIITPADADTVYNPVFVSADFNDGNGSSLWNVTSAASYSDTAAAKMSKVTIDKKAEKDAGTSYDNEWRSTRIGEIVHYTVETTIPGYGPVFENPHFAITDKLTDLTMDADQQAGIKVKVDGIEVAEDPAATYDLDPAADGYTITFAPAYLKGIKVPTKVEVTYSATVSTDAKLNVNTEENEVWVEFSHKSQAENDYIYKKDDTNHYTFTIDAKTLGGYESGVQKSGTEIVKVGVDASGHPITEVRTSSQVTEENYVEGPLEGATFKLYKTYDEKTKTGEEYVKVDGTTFADLKSDAAGRINIEGLDGGVYYLVEETAPDGFVKSTKPVKIEIIPEYEKDKEVTMWTDGTDWQYEKDATHTKSAKYYVDVLKKVTIKINDVETTTHTFYNEGKKEIKYSSTGTKELPSSIVNTKGVELPSTGGMGTTIFYIIGSILVIGAGVILVTRRRMSAN